MANSARVPWSRSGGGLDAEPFRREVQQVELAGAVGLLHLAPLSGFCVEFEEAGPDTERVEGVHLVLHEGDQGEMTTPVPRRTSAGSGSQRLPPPVGMSTRASPPSTTVLIISCCSPRKAS